jgi:dolichol kinase
MMASGVSRGPELSRKTLHLTTASVPVSLWLGVEQRIVAATLVALFGVACAVEIARRRSPSFGARFTATVGVMLRPHEVAEGVTGATWLLSAFAFTCLAAPLSVAIAATWAGAIGDASAALLGRAWRLARGGSGKTAAGAWWLGGFSPVAALGLGAVAALAEWPAITLDDNVRVTTAVAIAAFLFLRV